MSKPLKVFITYSHKDPEQNKELKTRLAVMEQEGKIEIWDDNKILPGDEWQKDISDNLAESDILLYLVSATSLASKNCNKEFAEALSTNIRVIPIILEACDWDKHQLGRFEVLPHKGKPINKWKPQSDGWQNVVDGIRNTVKEMQAQVDAPSRTPEEELRAELAFQHGNVFMMIKQFNKAVERYSYAIELNPDFAEAYNNRGVAYNIKGDFDPAIADFTKAMQLTADNTIPYNNRAGAYIDKGDFDRAIIDCNKAMEIDLDDVEAYNNRGLAHHGKKDYNLAILDFSKAIDLKQDYTIAYNNRGNLYRNIGKIDCAFADFDKAIELNPDYADAYFNRGNLYRDIGEISRAFEDYNTALEFNPDLAEVYNNRGNLYRNIGEIDRAIADFDKAIELNSNDP